MSVRPITTPEAHAIALARIDKLMDAEAGTPEADELELLATLVEKYEQERFPTSPPTQLEVVQFRMEQAGCDQPDLAKS